MLVCLGFWFEGWVEGLGLNAYRLGFRAQGFGFRASGSK